MTEGEQTGLLCPPSGSSPSPISPAKAPTIWDCGHTVRGMQCEAKTTWSSSNPERGFEVHSGNKQSFRDGLGADSLKGPDQVKIDDFSRFPPALKSSHARALFCVEETARAEPSVSVVTFELLPSTRSCECKGK